VDVANEGRKKKGVRGEVSELWELVLAYARQETIDPLKRLGRYIAFGVAGSVLVAVGLVLLALAGLRVLQLETAPHLAGNWSWVPYLAVTVVAGAIIGALVWAIGADRRRSRRQRRPKGA
jgi:mannose/fructose/N-acetylgalactosamine-specific phosphotransferase system component IIC